MVEMPPAIDTKFQQALESFRSGDLDRAEQICARILKKVPRHPVASHLLGVIRLQRGDPKSARPLLQAAVKLDPANLQALEDLGVAEWSAQEFDRAEAAFKQAVQRGKRDASTLTWCGLALASQSKHAEAAEYFRRAIEVEPRNANLWVNLGNAVREQDKLEEAQECYRTALALTPDHLEARYHLGAVLQAQGKLTEAVAGFEAVLALAPAHVDAVTELGITLQGLGRFEEAERRFRQAVELDAASPEMHFNLGSALKGQGKLDQAIACFERALALQSDHVKTLNNLGNTLIDRHDFEAAAGCFERMIAADPANVMGYYNLGVTLRATRRYDAAIASYEKALALKPDYVEALNDLGVVFQEQGKVDQALASFRRALEIRPGYADAALSMGVVLLYQENFAEGWRYYEARFDTDPPKAVRRPLASPRVTPETLHSIRKLAVWAEQGLGDAILYSSLIPELVARDVNFVFEVDRRLLETYRRSFPEHDFVPQDAASAALLEAADANVPVGSLPSLFRTRREDFSRQPQKFLDSDPEKRARFRNRLGMQKRGLRVAISWKSTYGQERALVQFRKSATLDCFARMAKMPGNHLVDVQYGDTGQERTEFAERTGIAVTRVEGVDYFRDVDDVLAVIDACDLVITTSNVTAHFAGALGKPTWLLYPGARAPFFYCIATSEGRSLWYPSIEVITAPHLTGWDALFQHAAEKLEPLLTGIAH